MMAPESVPPVVTVAERPEGAERSAPASEFRVLAERFRLVPAATSPETVSVPAEMVIVPLAEAPLLPMVTFPVFVDLPIRIVSKSVPKLTKAVETDEVKVVPRDSMTRFRPPVKLAVPVDA